MRPECLPAERPDGPMLPRLGFEFDESSAGLPDDDDDTVFLAPRLRFTSGGRSSDQAEPLDLADPMPANTSEPVEALPTAKRYLEAPPIDIPPKLDDKPTPSDQGSAILPTLGPLELDQGPRRTPIPPLEPALPLLPRSAVAMPAPVAPAPVPPSPPLLRNSRFLTACRAMPAWRQSIRECLAAGWSGYSKWCRAAQAVAAGWTRHAVTASAAGLRSAGSIGFDATAAAFVILTQAVRRAGKAVVAAGSLTRTLLAAQAKRVAQALVAMMSIVLPAMMSMIRTTVSAAAQALARLTAATATTARASGAPVVMATSRARPLIGKAVRKTWTALADTTSRAGPLAWRTVGMLAAGLATSAVAIRSFLWREGYPRIGGLAAASVGVVILSIIWGPTPAQLRPHAPQALLALPDKPAIAADEEAKTAIDSGTAPHLPAWEIEVPLQEIIAHINAVTPRSAPKLSSPAAASIVGPDLLTRIEAIDGLGEFARAARVVGLDTLLQPNEAYTMFIPNDAAFAELGKDEIDRLLAPPGHEQLLTLLSHHIIEQRLSFSDFAGEVGRYTTLADRPMTISATDEIRIDQAAMVDSDLEAGTGVIHVIDQLLVLEDP